jgi:hypothetical protein
MVERWRQISISLSGLISRLPSLDPPINNFEHPHLWVGAGTLWGNGLFLAFILCKQRDKKSLTLIFRHMQAPLYKRLCPLVRWSVGLLVRCPLVRWSVGPSVRLSICTSGRPSVCPSVRPHITLNTFFSAICGQIDLKFGGALHVNFLFQFLLFYFSTPPLTPPSPQKLSLFVNEG